MRLAMLALDALGCALRLAALFVPEDVRRVVFYEEQPADSDDERNGDESERKLWRRTIDSAAGKRAMAFGFIVGMLAVMLSGLVLRAASYYGDVDSKGFERELGEEVMGGKVKSLLGAQAEKNQHIAHVLALLQLNEDLHGKVLETKLGSVDVEMPVIGEAIENSLTPRFVSVKAEIAGAIEAGIGEARKTSARSSDILTALQKDIIKEMNSLTSVHQEQVREIYALYRETLHKVSTGILFEMKEILDQQCKNGGKSSESHINRVLALQQDHWILHARGVKRLRNGGNVAVANLGPDTSPESYNVQITLFFQKTVEAASDQDLEEAARKCAPDKTMVTDLAASCQSVVEGFLCGNSERKALLNAVGLSIKESDDSCPLVEIVRFYLVGAGPLLKLAKSWETGDINAKKGVLGALKQLALEKGAFPRAWLI